MLVMTETVQDYLKAIWMLDRSGAVSTSALAERLSVTVASASTVTATWCHASSAGTGLVVSRSNGVPAGEAIPKCMPVTPFGARYTKALFDAVPKWFSERTLRGEMRTGAGYSAPPMPWGLDAGELQKVRGAHPGITEVRELRVPRGRGLYHGALAPLQHRLNVVRNLRPTMTAVARFA